MTTNLNQLAADVELLHSRVDALGIVVTWIMSRYSLEHPEAAIGEDVIGALERLVDTLAQRARERRTVDLTAG